MRRLRRLGVRTLHAGGQARRGAHRAGRRWRKRLRRFRRHPRQRMRAGLHALGVPALPPYVLGTRLFEATLGVPTLRRRLVEKTCRRASGHPVTLGRPLRDAWEVEQFLSCDYQMWRMYALADCSMDTFRRFAHFEGLEHITEAQDDGHGVLLVGAHFGWATVLPVALQRSGLDPACLWGVQGLSPPGVRLIRPPHPERLMLRPLLEARKILRSGGVVHILADALYGERDVVVPFLDGTQRLARGFAALSLATGAPVIPLRALPRRGGHFSVEFHRRLVAPEAGSREERIHGLVRQYARLLESWLVESPLLYVGHFERLRSGGTWDAKRLCDIRSGS